jgi:hypothetical protein
MVSDKGREEVDDQQLTLIGQERTMTTSPCSPVSGSMTSKLFLTLLRRTISFITSTCVTCFLFKHAVRWASRMHVQVKRGQRLNQRIHQEIRFMGIYPLA